MCVQRRLRRPYVMQSAGLDSCLYRSLVVARPWDEARTVGPPDGFLLNGQMPVSLLASRARKFNDNRDPPRCHGGAGGRDFCGQRGIHFSHLELLLAAPSLLHGAVSSGERNWSKKHSHWRVQRGKRMAIAWWHAKDAWPPSASNNSPCISGSGANGSVGVARCKP